MPSQTDNLMEAYLPTSTVSDNLSQGEVEKCNQNQKGEKLLG